MLLWKSAGLRRSIAGRYIRVFSSGQPEWKTKVENLQKRSNDLDTTIRNTGLSSPSAQNESYSLFHDWRQILFQIPKEESVVLETSAHQIDTLLRHNLSEHGSKHLSDDVTTAIYAWGRTATLDKNSPMRAEALLKTFLEKDDNHGTSKMYSAMVYCWSQAPQNKIASKQSLAWFRKLQTVDAATWNALLRVHVRQNQLSGIPSTLLKRHSYLNDGYTVCLLVEGWLDSDPKKAYEELQKGIAFCLEKGEDQIPALQQLLFLYLSKSIEKGRLLQAEKVLHQAIGIQENDMQAEILQQKHFVVVMNALAKKGKAEQTNQLFGQLKNLYEKGAQQLRPNYQILVILLSAIAKKKDRTSLEIGESLLSTIEAFLLQDEDTDITNHAYNIMLDFYVQSPHADNKRERIEALIQRMKALAVEHNNPKLLPDKVSYASLIKCIVQEGASYEKVEEILCQMEESDETFRKPDRKIYAMVLETLFASGDEAAVDRANDLVTRMKTHTTFQPDRVIYTVLMKIHSLCKDVRGSDEVLDTMIQAYKSGRKDCRPNEEAFITAMSTWEQSNRPDSMDGALRIFNDMVSLYKKGNHHCKPSLKSFGKLMVILAKSEDASKLEKAQRLFAEMKKYNVDGDGSLLNWYIRVCATAHNKDPERSLKSWNEALKTFQQLHSRGMANSHTYNSIFYACDNLLQDDRDFWFHSMFQKCRDDGMVNRRILMSLKRSLPFEVFSELTGLDPKDNNIQMKQIPASWKRNNRNKQGTK